MFMAVNEEPRKLALRRSDVLAWTGLSHYELDTLIAQGVVHGRRLTPNGRLYFYREHIREVILKPLENHHEQQPNQH
jgi:hypothetical protein